MIEVKNLSKSYGERMAIQSLNFSVKKGEVVGFLGPNGAGKSTTMKIITGYMAPTSGEVHVAGFDVFAEPLEVKRRIGYLPETPPVYIDMFVRDYLEFVSSLKGVERSRQKALVNAALEKTNLGDVQGRMIGNLSKGFRQRVGLAQALVSDPEILILDEPTVGLDPKQMSEIRHLIQQLKGQHTVILSTHILHEVQASCEKVIIINKGQIVAEDSLAGLSRRMSGGGQVVTVKVRRNQAAIVNRVGQLEGVHRANNEGNYIEIETNGDEALVEQIAKLIVESECGLMELKTQSLDLEDIFIKLTTAGQVAGEMGA